MIKAGVFQEQKVAVPEGGQEGVLRKEVRLGMAVAAKLCWALKAKMTLEFNPSTFGGCEAIE